MPVDVRKLIFSKKELRLAFQTYARDKNLNVPDSHVQDLQIIDSGQSRVVSDNTPEGMKVVLHYTSSDPNNPIRLHLDQHQILEALIGMCRSLHIPLPRRSQKFLQKHKDGLSMTVGMNEQDILQASGVANG